MVLTSSQGRMIFPLFAGPEGYTGCDDFFISADDSEMTRENDT